LNFLETLKFLSINFKLQKVVKGKIKILHFPPLFPTTKIAKIAKKSTLKFDFRKIFYFLRIIKVPTSKGGGLWRIWDLNKLKG